MLGFFAVRLMGELAEGSPTGAALEFLTPNVLHPLR